jgi:DNA repair exonuclease SbcCD ATPase subunit
MSLSESQRLIETHKLRERDQSAAITENTARIEDLERRLLHTQKEFDRVQNELDDQDALMDNLKQELDTAREEAKIAESAALGREAESLRREKSLRRGETERYTNDLSQRDRSIADLSSQLSNIQQQHASQSQTSRDLQSRFDTQAQQHDLAIRDLETQLVMLKSETAILKAEKDEMLGSRQQRAEEARKQRELDEQREKYRTSVADDLLVQELEVLKKQNSQLTRDLQYSESERQSTEQTLSRQIELLEKQISDHADTVVAVGRGGGQDATDRERMLEERCKELQDELSSILDDFERLTSQFIDHEAFRQSLESQIDVLRGQCHDLQTELAEEKVRHLGRDVTSPVQGGFTTEQTSTGTLRTEFRKMVAELRNEHVVALKVLISGE